MSFILRVIGALWIILTAKVFIFLLRDLLTQGWNLHLNLKHLLDLVMLAGGIGLLLLKEWGRWMLLLGSLALLILMVGPSLLQGKIGPVVIRNFVFYGIFIALLILPQSKAVTR